MRSLLDIIFFASALLVLINFIQFVIGVDAAYSRRRRKIMGPIGFVFLVSLSNYLFAQTPTGVRIQNAVIPDNVMIPWAAGPDYVQDTNGWTHVNLTAAPYSMVGDDSTDNSAGIVLLNALAGAGTVAYLPTGIYRTSTPLYIHSSTNKGNLLLYGDGTNSVLKGNFENTYASNTWPALIYIRGASSGTTYTPTDGLAKQSTNITVSATLSTIAVGDYVSLREDNNPTNMIGALSATQLHGQFFRVLGKPSGTSFTTSRPIFSPFYTALNPVVREILPVTNLVIRDMMLDNQLSLTMPALVDIFQSCNVTITNVRGYKPVWYHVNLSDSWKCSVRGNVFSEAHTYGQGGYGVNMLGRSCDNLIEDNTFPVFRHSVVVQSGGSGNVIGYNCSVRGQDVNGLDVNILEHDFLDHGNYPSQNLFEGNIGMKFNQDSYWGNNGPVVVFRNHFWRYSKGYNDTVDGFLFAMGSERGSYSNYWVGNILGLPGQTATTYTNTTHAAGEASPGNVMQFGFDSARTNAATTLDLNVQATTWLHGNHSYHYPAFTNVWLSGVSQRIPPSLYYAEKPAFMTGHAWPPFGPDVSGLTNTIPAYTRMISIFGTEHIN